MTSSPFGNFLDKFKSTTKQAAESMKLAGRIAGLKVERSTQKAEKERLLKDIGSKIYSIYSKTKTLDSASLNQEITSEIQQIERIDKRLEELEAEIVQLQQELMHSETVVDASEVKEVDKKTSKE
ncbi:MAG: hypothetical protein K2W82_19130 [Candidatus Obscuribacterales bacterium]|nr:hypothetical protein [Candidatus Obscuribacterales bacterium]